MLPLTIFLFYHFRIHFTYVYRKIFQPPLACYRLVYRRSDVRMQAYAETAKTPEYIAFQAFLAFFYKK